MQVCRYPLQPEQNAGPNNFLIVPNIGEIPRFVRAPPDAIRLYRRRGDKTPTAWLYDRLCLQIYLAESGAC